MRLLLEMKTISCAQSRITRPVQLYVYLMQSTTVNHVTGMYAPNNHIRRVFFELGMATSSSLHGSGDFQIVQL